MFLFVCVRIGLSAYLVYEIWGCLSCSQFASQIFPGSYFHISACMFFVNHLASAYLNIKNFFNHQRQEHSLMNIHIFPPPHYPAVKAKQPSIALITGSGVLIGCRLPRAFYFFIFSLLLWAVLYLPTTKKKTQKNKKNPNNARINFSGWKTTLQTCQTVPVACCCQSGHQHYLRP